MIQKRVATQNISICAIGAEEFHPSTFVIQFSFCTLAVSKQKLRPSGLDRILIPHSTNAWTLSAMLL